MQRVIEKLQYTLDPILTKINNLKILLILDAGMRRTGPFIFVGSLFVILTQLPFTAWQHWLAPIMPQLQVPINLTLGIFALIVALNMSVAAAKFNQLSPKAGVTVGLIAFLIATLNQHWQIQLSAFGPQHFFTAIFIPLLALELLRWLTQHPLKYHGPANLPPAVPESFTSLIPETLTVIVFWALRVLIKLPLDYYVRMIMAPFVTIFNSFTGIMVILFFTLLLWILGIHGNNVIGAILSPFYLQSLVLNAVNVTAGHLPTRVTADGFLTFGMNIGGTGAILALALCLLTSKSKRFKELGHNSWLPSLFGISEPIVFGLPVVLNPALMVPFLFIPMLLQGVTYYLMQAHLIGMVIAQVPWTTPTILSGFLITGGDWRAAVWQLLELIIAVLIYWPFFKRIDQQAWMTEQAATN